MILVFRIFVGVFCLCSTVYLVLAFRSMRAWEARQQKNFDDSLQSLKIFLAEKEAERKQIYIDEILSLLDKTNNDKLN